MIPKTILTGVCCCALASFTGVAQASNLSSADKQFVRMAAEANMTEANMAQMAEKDATKQDVKDYARKLEQDHSQAYSDLLDLSQKIGQPIPRGINIRRNASATQLMHMKGDGFDRAYVKDEIQDHEKAVAMFQREADHGTDPDVKAYATKVLPTLHEHLEKAKELAGK
jgi:putative membrane protein